MGERINWIIKLGIIGIIWSLVIMAVIWTPKMGVDMLDTYDLIPYYSSEVNGEAIELPDQAVEGCTLIIKWTLQPNRTYLLVDPVLFQYNFWCLNFTVNETTIKYQGIQIWEETYFGLMYYKPNLDFGETHWTTLIAIEVKTHG